MCAPFGPLPGLLVPASMNGGVSESPTFTSAGFGPRPRAMPPDPPVAVGGHVIEHLDLALEHLVVGRQHVFLVLHGVGLTLRGLPLMKVRKARSPKVAKPSVVR